MNFSHFFGCTQLHALHKESMAINRGKSNMDTFFFPHKKTWGVDLDGLGEHLF